MEEELDLVFKSAMHKFCQILENRPKIQNIAERMVKGDVNLDDLTFDVIFQTNGMEKNKESSMRLLTSYLVYNKMVNSDKKEPSDVLDFCSENLFEVILHVK